METPWTTSMVVRDINILSNGLKEVKIFHVFKEGNCPTNWLANLARMCGCHNSWTGEFP